MLQQIRQLTPQAGSLDALQSEVRYIENLLSAKSPLSLEQAMENPAQDWAVDQNMIANGVSEQLVLQWRESRARLFTRLKHREFSIAGRELHVFDNVLLDSAINAIDGSLAEKHYTLTESDLENGESPIFATELDVQNRLPESSLDRHIAELVCTSFHQQAHRPERSYVNLSRYGDMAYPHRDAQGSMSKNVTALAYLNRQWQIEFGGETKFFDEDGTSIGVLPHPGRLALFRGYMLHVGSIPNRECRIARYTMATKFKGLRKSAS